MLSRANSDAAARLRRSKSNSTVHKRPTSIAEPLDLDAIREQALAAATTAFARAKAPDAIEYTNRRSSDLPKSKDNASRKSLTTQGNHFPPLGSSFRSMPVPKAEQGKGSQRKSQAPISHIEQTTEQPSRFHSKPTSDDFLPASHQLSKQASVTLAGNDKPSFQQKTVQPTVASSVTSQQIRKARSMYYASSIQTGSPIARHPVKFLTSTHSDDRSPGSDTLSMQPPIRTFGRSPLTEPRIPVTVAPGITLNEARDEYLHEFQQSSVKHKHSMFLVPFKKRQDKAKDKAKSVSSDTQLFTTSGDSMPIEPNLDATLSSSMSQQDLGEKRSFSGSLKHRIKRVFRRTLQKPTELPVQHIKARRQYFDAPHLSPSSVGDTSSIPCPDETTLKRVRGHASSLEKSRPGYLRSGYRSDSTGSGRSARSLHSEVNGPYAPASRVTSWGTTSTRDTLTQRTIKRMTVIHESKDSIGSEVERVASATALRRNSLPLPPLSSFRDPMPMHSLSEEETSPIDPKRVFSALMREMRTTESSQESSVPARSTSSAENGLLESSITIVQDQYLSSSDGHNIQASTDASQRQLSRQSVMAHSVRRKTSTVKALGKAIRSTIRAVTPAGQQLPSNTETAAIASDAANIYESDHDPPSATTFGNESSQEGSSTTQRQHTPFPYTPSTSQIEKRFEKSRDRWKAHLEDPEHFQFPRETDKTYDITAFVGHPRATPSNSTRSSRKSEPHDYSTMEKDIIQPPLSLEVSKSTSIEMPMSPSIYSRNTDGISVNQNDSVTSFDNPGQLEQSQNTGSAVVLTSQPVRSYVVGTPSPQRQEVSHTSHDWRAWLSREISTMKMSSREDLTINETYRVFPKRDQSDSMRVSNAENGDTAVTMRDCLDATASQLDKSISAAASTFCRVESPGYSSDNMNKSTIVGTKLSEEYNEFHNTTNTDDGSHITTSQLYNTSKAISASFSSKPRPLSTSNIHASYSGDTNTLAQSPRNRQGALTDTIRCSSSDSLASQHSISPTNSTTSPSFSKSPKPTPEGVFCSSFSDRSTKETPQRLATTPLKRHDTQVRRKENLTPKSPHAHKKSVPSPVSLLPRSRSYQLLSCSTLNCSSPNADQLSVAMGGITSTKSLSTPVATSLRPRIRVIARPISAEKRVQQPKSALNLKATGNFESPNRLAGFAIASPASHSRTGVRDPVLCTTPSSPSSLLLDKEPSSARTTAATTFYGECYLQSTTPGQRMADQFLRQLPSTIGCEERTGKRKGGKFLVREDTPAFL